jgi:hypothetical protein
MGVYKLSTAGGLATPRTNYSSFLAGNPAFEVSQYQSIATVTVGSGGSATVSFTSIPATYTHLQVRGIARTNRSGSNQDAIRYRFNSDSGSNYTLHYLYGNGSTAAAGANTSDTQAYMDGFTESDNLAGAFGGFILDILDYTNTNKYKTSRSWSGREDNTSGAIWFESTVWMNTAAITSIVFTPNSGTSIDQYSQFALYGIKGA